jgi:hypothetical protein
MLKRAALPVCIVFGLVGAGCSSSGSAERATFTYTTGDKAPVDKLTYSVVDTAILPHLGDETTPRIPHYRFYVVDISISNSSSTDSPIPGMTLVDDAGKNYDELPDGSGVPHWLGVVRKVAANQTEQGAVVFDAPAGHYKLKLTDDTDASDVYVDIPLTFAHEQMQNDTQSTSEAVTSAGSPVAVPTKKK